MFFVIFKKKFDFGFMENKKEIQGLCFGAWENFALYKVLQFYKNKVFFNKWAKSMPAAAVIYFIYFLEF